MASADRIKALRTRPDNWGMHRLQGARRAETIIWNTDVVKRLDSGFQILCQSSSPPPERDLMWVRFLHIESGQKFTVANVHLDAYACFRGAYGAGATKRANVGRYQTQMRNIVPILKQLKDRGGPVFLTGDFNCNYRADKALRKPGLPYQVFHRLGFNSIYDKTGFPSIGTIGRGGSLFDNVYMAQNSGKQVVRPEWMKILRGYHSDHRPVIATYSMKRMPQKGKH